MGNKDRNKDFADFRMVGTAVLLTVSFIASLLYLRVGLARVFYPYALDLIEEDMLMQAWRVAQGLPVFVPPNADFVPQVYMPLFTWLGGHLLQLTGFAFWPLRLISFLSTLGTAVLITFIGWRECGRKGISLAGGALFLAGYRLVGGWYDLARVDALYTFLSLAGLVLLVYGRSSYINNLPQRTQRSQRKERKIGVNLRNLWINKYFPLSWCGLTQGVSCKRQLLAGLLLGLAFLTKQNALLLAFVAGFYLFFTAEGAEEKSVFSVFIRVPMLFAITFLLVSGVPTAVLQVGSSGWFRFYTVTIAYASPLAPIRLWHILRWELLGGMGVLVGFWWVTAVLQIIQTGKRLEIRDWRLLLSGLQSLIFQNPWLLFSGTAVFISAAGRTTVGGNLNNLIMGYAFLCLAPALLLKAFARAKVQSRDDFPLAPLRLGVRKYWLFNVALLLQFGLVFFPLNPGLPKTYLPTAAMRAAGDTFLARVAETDGEVWLLLHPSYAVMAGKRPFVHLQSLWHARHRGADPLPADLLTMLETQQFTQIISDESDYFETEPAFLDVLLTYYEPASLLEDEQSPATLSGPVVRPLTIYIPRR